MRETGFARERVSILFTGLLGFVSREPPVAEMGDETFYTSALSHQFFFRAKAPRQRLTSTISPPGQRNLLVTRNLLKEPIRSSAVPTKHRKAQIALP